MSLTEHEVQSLDKCPKCGREHRGYNSLDFDRGMIYLRFTCYGCGMEHVEAYKYAYTWFETFEEEA